jgi:REP element-mobilizing transposase RayT
MRKPIVIAYHLIWTVYGYWLPNDPRGSMSKTIASDIIAELGRLHYGRKLVQPSSAKMREFHESARGVLKHPLLDFQLADFPIIAEGLDDAIRKHNYTCYACAIMPDHVHILIRKHKHLAEEMLSNFQAATRLRIRNASPRTEDHPVWGGPGWKVFLGTPADIKRTIGYIISNPPKQRLPRQIWPFVKPYDGWPFHRGYNPNSPYTRRLREIGKMTLSDSQPQRMKSL